MIRIFTNSKNSLISKFLQLNEHHWISENSKVLNCILEVFDRMSFDQLNKVLIKSSLVLCRSNAKLACTVDLDAKNVLMIFPDLFKMMNRYSSVNAQAILAHEFGHIYYQHSKVFHKSILEKQKEADFFAHLLGYNHELQELLTSRSSIGLEAQVRLSYLTALDFDYSNKHSLLKTCHSTK